MLRGEASHLQRNIQMRKYIHLLLDTKTFPHHVRTTAGAFCGRHELGLTPVSCAMTPQRLADVLSNDSNTHKDIFARYNGFLLSPSPFLASSSSSFSSFLTLQHLIHARTTIMLVSQPPPHRYPGA